MPRLRSLRTLAQGVASGNRLQDSAGCSLYGAEGEIAVSSARTLCVSQVGWRVLRWLEYCDELEYCDGWITAMSCGAVGGEQFPVTRG